MKCEGSKVSWKTFARIAAFVFGFVLTAKLNGQVDWPWWAILSPLWGLAAFLLAAFVLAWGDMFRTGR